MTHIPTTSINFVVLWVSKQPGGTYADRDGFNLHLRPTRGERFQIGDRQYEFSHWDYQDGTALVAVRPRTANYNPDDYEFWYFIDVEKP
jgi:hypothetical protein